MGQRWGGDGGASRGDGGRPSPGGVKWEDRGEKRGKEGNKREKKGREGKRREKEEERAGKKEKEGKILHRKSVHPLSLELFDAHPEKPRISSSASASFGAGLGVSSDLS